MATAILNWIPGGGGGSQIVEFKQLNEPTWHIYSTLSPSSTTETVIGLADNITYAFRLYNSCSGGTSSFTEQSIINLTCPVVSVISTDTTAQVTFPSLGGSIDQYVIDLLDNTGTSVHSVTLLGPFSSSVTYLFTELISSTPYGVRVKPIAGTYVKQNCATTTFGTLDAPSCGLPGPMSSVMS